MKSGHFYFNETPDFSISTRQEGGALCSIDLEMSALVDLEMSSFGVCSIVVDRTTFSGGGDADIEPQGS
jgi:hypothetical protein